MCYQVNDKLTINGFEYTLNYQFSDSISTQAFIAKSGHNKYFLKYRENSSLIKNEIKIIKLLKEIPTLKDLVPDVIAYDDNHIVLEYYDGFKNISKGNGNINNLYQASKVILALHSLGYILMDIKPTNILVSGNQTKVIDFEHCVNYIESVKNNFSIRWVGVKEYSPYNEFKSEIPSFAGDVYSFAKIIIEVIDKLPDWFSSRYIAQARPQMSNLIKDIMGIGEIQENGDSEYFKQIKTNLNSLIGGVS